MLLDTVRRRGTSRRGAVLAAASSRMRGTRGATASRSRGSPLPHVARNH